MASWDCPSRCCRSSLTGAWIGTWPRSRSCWLSRASPQRRAGRHPRPATDGIVLPDAASEKPQAGSVLAVGPGRVLDNGKRVEMDVKTGDTVLFARYAGTEVKLDGDEYLVIREA